MSRNYKDKYTYQCKGKVLSNHPNAALGEIKDIRGQKFGYLTVENFDSIDSHGESKWLCLCTCGKETIVTRSHLMTGHTNSCGHLKGIGLCHEDWARNYAGMVERATHPEKHNYKKRFENIDKTIEPEWLDDPYAFYKEIDPKPGKNYSIDRIDNTKGYVKGNIRWATPEMQAKNRTTYQEGKVVPIKGISLKKRGTNRLKRDIYIVRINNNRQKITYKTTDLKTAIKIRYLLERKYGYTHYDEILKYAKPEWNNWSLEKIDSFLENIKKQTYNRMLSSKNPLQMINQKGITIFFNSKSQAEKYFGRTVHTRNINSGKYVKQGFFKGWMFKAKNTQKRANHRKTQYKPPITRKPIKAINKQGNILKFNSIKEAKKYFGGNANIGRLLQSGQFCISHRSKLLGWRFEYVNPEDGKQEHFSI